MVEGVHWDNKLNPADVGWKLIATTHRMSRNGCLPTWAVLTVSPRPVDRAWIKLARGLGEAPTHGQSILAAIQHEVRRLEWCSTMGGHTTNPVGRCGAQIGDDIWVTGTLVARSELFVGGTHPRGDHPHRLGWVERWLRRRSSLR